uniref:Uncharacterized protein n=1 Tax=Caenorhabditis japonica TaxID=281687 RepID=A0A8R1ENB5_CAEJA
MSSGLSALMRGAAVSAVRQADRQRTIESSITSVTSSPLILRRFFLSIFYTTSVNDRRRFAPHFFASSGLLFDDSVPQIVHFAFHCLPSASHAHSMCGFRNETKANKRN